MRRTCLVDRPRMSAASRISTKEECSVSALNGALTGSGSCPLADISELRSSFRASACIFAGTGTPARPRRSTTSLTQYSAHSTSPSDSAQPLVVNGSASPRKSARSHR